MKSRIDQQFVTGGHGNFNIILRCGDGTVFGKICARISGAYFIADFFDLHADRKSDQRGNTKQCGKHCAPHTKRTFCDISILLFI